MDIQETQETIVNNNNIIYAGFWVRVFATLIDSFVIILILSLLGLGFIFTNLNQEHVPNMLAAFSIIHILSYLLVPTTIIVLLVKWNGQTPGKRILNIKVVDAITFETITYKQSTIRYLGYILSSLIFCIGYIMVAFTERKQSLHDKIANTVVIYTK